MSEKPVGNDKYSRVCFCRPPPAQRTHQAKERDRSPMAVCCFGVEDNVCDDTAAFGELKTARSGLPFGADLHITEKVDSHIFAALYQTRCWRQFCTFDGFLLGHSSMQYIGQCAEHAGTIDVSGGVSNDKKAHRTRYEGDGNQ